MTAGILIAIALIVLAAAVAWRLGTQRARPGLADHSTRDLPTSLQGDFPAIPDDLKAVHADGGRR